MNEVSTQSSEFVRRKLLNRAEAALYLNCKESTLAKGAHYGTGPKMVRVGRLVRYRIEDLDQWIEGRLTTNTLHWRDAGLARRNREAK